MSKEKKPAVGNTALDAFFGSTTEKPDSPDTSKRLERPRFTVRIREELQERVRDVCYWDRKTITEFVELALEAEIQRREEARGQAYPTREEEIKPGRPVR